MLLTFSLALAALQCGHPTIEYTVILPTYLSMMTRIKFLKNLFHKIHHSHRHFINMLLLLLIFQLNAFSTFIKVPATVLKHSSVQHSPIIHTILTYRVVLDHPKYEHLNERKIGTISQSAPVQGDQKQFQVWRGF